MKINSINTQYQYQNNKRQVSKQAAPSFKGGATEPIINGLSNFYEGVAKTKPFQNFIHNFSKSNNSFTHVLVAESCFLSGFYMLSTLRNKKIKKEQKPQMLINDALTWGVSTAGAYLAEDKITSVVNKGAEKYFTNNRDFYVKLGKKAQEAAGKSVQTDLLNKVGEIAGKKGNELSQGIDDVAAMIGSHLKDIVGEEGTKKAFSIAPDKLKEVQASVKNAITSNAGNTDKAKEAVKGLVDDVYNSAAARKEADKLLPGINKLKVLIIFGIIYRYLGPVVITPIANKLSSKLFNNKKENAEQAQAKK